MSYFMFHTLKQTVHVISSLNLCDCGFGKLILHKQSKNSGGSFSIYACFLSIGVKTRYLFMYARPIEIAQTSSELSSGLANLSILQKLKPNSLFICNMKSRLSVHSMLKF